MEITNFLNADALITYTVTLLMVELWVAFTKELPFIKKIPTKYYTFVLAIIHLAIINVQVALFSMDTLGVYVLLCNALILSVLLNSGYDMAVGKITINKESDKK
ncbi:MAG: hypothetical protein ACRDD7_09170 [Peptostreptococcaceae bacterium]